MDSFRQKQLDLLVELDKTCRELDVPYILSSHTAQAAYLNGKFATKIAVPTIAMKYRDAQKLVQAMKNKENRNFESALDNRNITRPIIRYCDTSTTLYNSKDFSDYKCKGICIDIELIRGINGNKILRKAITSVEKLCLLAANARRKSTTLRILLSPFSPLEKVFLKKIYNSKVGNKGMIARFPEHSAVFPVGCISETEDICLLGRNFKVPKEFEKYMIPEFGLQWQEKKIKASLEDIHTAVIDPNSSYKEYCELLNSKNSNGKVNMFALYILHARIRHIRGIIRSYWEILFFTRDRFSLWKQYMPIKDRICSLYAEGKTDEVRLEMQDYIDAIDNHLTSGMTLCFDQDLLNIAIDIIREEKGNAYANMLQSKVQKKHLQPIMLKESKND